MAYIFDLALLVISGCSAVYCWTLSRRLRALQNLKSGMGQAMVGLTKSVTAVEANAQKLHREAAAAIVELKDRLAEVDAYEARVDVMLETMDRQAREAWKDYRTRTETAAQRAELAAADLGEILADAKSLTVLMNKQLVALSAARRDRPASAKPAEREAESKADVPSETATVVPLPTAAAAPSAPRQPFASAPAPAPAAEQAVEARRAGDREMMLKALRAAKASAAERKLKEAQRPDEGAAASPRVAEAVRRFGQGAAPASARKPFADNPFLDRQKKGGVR